MLKLTTGRKLHLAPKGNQKVCLLIIPANQSDVMSDKTQLLSRLPQKVCARLRASFLHATG